MRGLVAAALLAAAAAAPVNDAPLTLVRLPQAFADAYGAKCLDGTPPAHYTLKQDPARWIIFIEGGGWCWSPASCAGRAGGGGGSSLRMAPSMVVGGLLSPNATRNPRFFNYSMAFLHYCDGSSHSSNLSAPIVIDPPVGGVSQIWSRGRANLAAQVDYLLTAEGAAAAAEVIVTGGSAGGLSVFLGLDFVAARFPPAARVVGAPDAGFFIDAPRFNSTELTFGDEFAAADASTFGALAAGSLAPACVAVHGVRCYTADHAAPYVRTPWHSMMAAFDLASIDMILFLGCKPPACGAPQLEALRAWRVRFVGALVAAVDSYPGNGGYVDSCLVHEQNVDYCSGQSVPNCRGWQEYAVTAPPFPPALSPAEGFALWYDALQADWDGVAAARRAWGARVDAAPAGAYPRKTPAERAAHAALLGGARTLVIDPLGLLENDSCPWGRAGTPPAGGAGGAWRGE